MTLPGGKVQFEKAPSPSPIRFTKHTVKFHHHADGHSFFSETGKIISTHWFGINTHSFPIQKFNGHFATMMLQGTDMFELTDKRPIKAKKYYPIACSFPDGKDDAYKIVFWCYSSEDEVKKVLKQYEKNPEVLAGHKVLLNDGRKLEEWFIRDKSEKLFFVITAEQMPRFSDKNYPTQMSFIAGFDTKITDIKSDTTFLMLAYPIRKNFTELTQQFGSADYEPGAQIE